MSPRIQKKSEKRAGQARIEEIWSFTNYVIATPEAAQSYVYLWGFFQANEMIS